LRKPDEERPSFRLLGLLIIIQLTVSALLYLRSLREHQQQQQQLSPSQAAENEQAAAQRR
jgi:hypothetical protein